MLNIISKISVLTLALSLLSLPIGIILNLSIGIIPLAITGIIISSVVLSESLTTIDNREFYTSNNK